MVVVVVVEKKNEVLTYDAEFLPESHCYLRIALLCIVLASPNMVCGTSDFALHVIYSFAGFKSTHSIFR